MMKKWIIGIFMTFFLLLGFTLKQVQAQLQPPTDAFSTSPDSLAGVNPNNAGETLIDFREFEERIKKSNLYANKAGSDFVIEPDDLNYARWLVMFNSSANTFKTRKWSYAKKVSLRTSKKFLEPDAKNEVLGVRVHFPKHRFNAYARISPPYELRTYYDESDGVDKTKWGKVCAKFKEGKRIGVIDNVGAIKKISLDICSEQIYQYGIGIRLKDQFDDVKEYFMGYHSHLINWRRLNWYNPNYVSSIDQRDLFRLPLYPGEAPYIKFDSIIVYRSEKATKGDCILYFKKIDIWFDFAIAPESLNDVDIDDEDSWKILKTKAEAKRRLENLRVRERKELLKGLEK